MPRTARASVGGVCYHVINRGNGSATVFPGDSDYASFHELIGRACEYISVDVLAFCLMPNHFHLVLKPLSDGDLGRWMHRLLTSHVRRHHSRHQTKGHIWQGRFKAFPVQQDEHLLTVFRYVERNPLRGHLVRRAEDWRWSSLCARASGHAGFLREWPIKRPAGWEAYVNSAETSAELAALRASVNRGTPFGSKLWVARTADALGIEASTRPRGRPRAGAKK